MFGGKKDKDKKSKKESSQRVSEKDWKPTYPRETRTTPAPVAPPPPPPKKAEPMPPPPPEEKKEEPGTEGKMEEEAPPPPEPEPDKEPVRFKPRVAHDFPASQIDTLFPAEQKKPPVMVTNFMGLAGCHGPLPIAYTELILERVSNKDSSLKDFLDIFNHRLISIFYRIRKTCRIAFEQSDPAGSNFSRYLLALLGIGTKGLQNRMQVKDRAFLYYTGLCSQKPFSMSSLEAVLSHYFQINQEPEIFKN